jgi:tetratricopeptide (TPR) repeat protein
MTLPKVFISYSHDSPAHEARVLALSNRLRSHGIDAILDQYESFPSGGWLRWMKHQIRDAQFVLAVCTETYRRRWDGEEKAGVGLGAIYEGGLAQQLLYDAGGENERMVPVLLEESDGQYIPSELRRYTHFLPCTDGGYESLYRLLTGQPKVEKPVLGEPLVLKEAKADFRKLHLAWNAPPRNPFFTGRATQLEAIRQALTQNASAALTQPQAIGGLGGIGKTQTATEYAHRYRAGYAAVLWSGADSREALLSGFAVFARLLDLPLKDERDLGVVAAAVRRWLEANAGWLLVLDNVEDLALVREFAPVGADGYLLLTTRLHATGAIAQLVELKKMEPEEGALFLLRRAKVIAKDQSLDAAGEDDRTLARQISTEMGGLPLALDQAGAFIEETPSTLAEYLALYRAEGAALRARRGELARDHESVTITFSLAFARVAEANPAAAGLVRGCAFLAPEAIPEEVFTQAGSEWGEPIAALAAKPLAWLAVLTAAGRFALIHRDARDKSLHMHRLVQEVVKDEMDAATRRVWAERVVQALNAVFPNPEFQNWPQCERLLPHAKVAARLVEDFDLGSVVAARLLNRSGYYLDDRAQYAEAEPLYCRSVAISAKMLGPDHLDTAASLNNLAVLYRDQGRYAEAEPLFRRALAIHEKALGPDHPNTSANLGNLALLYCNQGRYADAEPLHFRALAIREKALGPDHPNTATSLNNLALLYDSQGRYAEAEPLFCRAVVIRERALGPNHPDTATSLSNLAGLYRDQGRYTEAEPLYQRALAIREKALGPDHPDTAQNLNNLAVLYRSQGRYAEAEPLYRRTLAICERALGPVHPHTATSLNNLAEIYCDQGRHAEAEPLYRRALTISEKALGPVHPDTAQSLNSLAALCYDQGRYAEAEPLFRRALDIREKALGPVHPDTAQSLNNLALLYRDQGRYAEAQPLLRRALTISEKALGPDHPSTATSLSSLAALYYNQGRYAEAEPLFRRALAISERALGPVHPDTAKDRYNLAALYFSQGRYAEAEPLSRRALTISEKAFGPDHPSTAQSLNNLAALYDNQGRYAEAEPLYRRALAIRERALGPDHPLTANSLNNLAVLYRNQGRYAEAEPLFRRALAIYEKTLEPDHPLTAQSLNNLAVLYYNQGRHAEAEPLFRRALAIRERALGPDHPHTAASIRDYAKLLRKLGRHAEAEKLEARAKAAKA